MASAGDQPKQTTRELLNALVAVSLVDEAAWDLRVRRCDPNLHPLMGADPCWSPAHESQLTAPRGVLLVDAHLGVPRPVWVCSICGGGIRPGDPYCCLGCQSVSPANASAIRRGTRPRKARPRRAPRGRTRLKAVERAALARKPEGPACLALCDARDAGDSDRASAIEQAFALHQSGLIGLDELNERAGTEPGTDPRRRRRRTPTPRKTA